MNNSSISKREGASPAVDNEESIIINSGVVVAINDQSSIDAITASDLTYESSQPRIKQLNRDNDKYDNDSDMEGHIHIQLYLFIFTRLVFEVFTFKLNKMLR